MLEIRGVGLFRVDQLQHLFAGREKRDRLGRDLDLLTRFGVASDAATAQARTKAAGKPQISTPSPSRRP